jgi:hypothetical protein
LLSWTWEPTAMSSQLIQKYYNNVDQLIRYGGTRNEMSLHPGLVKRSTLSAGGLLGNIALEAAHELADIVRPKTFDGAGIDYSVANACRCCNTLEGVALGCAAEPGNLQRVSQGPYRTCQGQRYATTHRGAPLPDVQSHQDGDRGGEDERQNIGGILKMHWSISRAGRIQNSPKIFTLPCCSSAGGVEN